MSVVPSGDTAPESGSVILSIAAAFVTTSVADVELVATGVRAKVVPFGSSVNA